MIKLIAIDMDDTVLNNKLEITDYTRKVIKTAVEQGIYITFATGRMYGSCRRFADELGLEVPLITYNGALIKQVKTEKVLFHQPVPLSVAQQIATWAERAKYYLQVYVNDNVYVREQNDKADFYSNHAKVEVHAVGDLTAFLAEAPTKMLIMAEQDNIEKVERELQELCGPTIYMARSKPTFLEIVHPVVSKGNALAYLANMLDVKRQDVMAIGDGHNDLEMLEYAGFSVAMGNAHPHVKEQADFVTVTNEEDGAAKAIMHVLNNREPGTGNRESGRKNHC